MSDAAFDLRIDPEFQSLIPPLSSEELSQLESNIIGDGCREPLTVWRSENILLDGHNRLSICGKHGLNFNVHCVDLPSRQHAINWIINNQLGRRNLTPQQASYLRGKRYNFEKKDREKNLLQNLPKDQFDPSVESTAERLATEFGVSAPTVKRDGAYAQDVDTLATNLGVDVRGDILSGKTKVTKQDVKDAADYYEQKDSGAYDWGDNGASESEIVVRGEDAILEAARKIRQQKSEQRRAERVEKINGIAQNNAPLDTNLDRLFPVIYADPPWRYEHSKTVNREIENHYPTMALDEICALPVGDIATPDSILYMWTTSPKLEESMRVLAAWGFTYRTCMVWVKNKIGMGYYARQRHELLLIAKRGDIPVPEVENRFDSVIEAPRGEHSAKPEIVYSMIEQMHPEFDKVELFARNRRDGWYAWGNQSHGN